MRDLHTGIVYVNAPTIGAEIHLPFGGTKRTGNGHREAGTAALDFYSEWKTLYIDYSDPLAARPNGQRVDRLTAKRFQFRNLKFQRAEKNAFRRIDLPRLHGDLIWQ